MLSLLLLNLFTAALGDTHDAESCTASGNLRTHRSLKTKPGPESSGPCPGPGDPNAVVARHSYDFTFADGTRVTGTSELNVVTVTVDGSTFDMHISCSDPFTDGYGTKGGPVEGVNPELVDWQIWKYRDVGSESCYMEKTCADLYPTANPSWAPIVSSRPTRFVSCQACDDPNAVVARHSYDFTFADGTRVTGTSEPNVVTVTVDGSTFDMHISCSDPFTDGYGTKGGPAEGVNPAIIDYHIWKYKDAGKASCYVEKSCAQTFPVPPEPIECRAPGDPNAVVARHSYDFTFADGTRVTGTSEPNVVTVTVDGSTFDMHISCSDPFTDGYGTKGGPVEGVNPELVDWQIWKYRDVGSESCYLDKTCADLYPTANPTASPTASPTANPTANPTAL